MKKSCSLSARPAIRASLAPISAAFCAVLFLSAAFLAGCKNSSDDPPPAAADVNAIIDGSSDDDGAKTVTFTDGEVKADEVDSLTYLFSGLSGEGKFEVKSNAGWTNITGDTMSVEAAGSDKIAKLSIDLTGTAKQYEMAYNIGDPKDISGSTVSFKMYIPPAYAEAGATAYPMVSLWTKTSGWTGTKFAEFNTLSIGSGWKTIDVDFAAKTVSVDGTALAAGTGETAAFSNANLANLTDTKLIVIGFYGDALPATMTGDFYFDWFNVSGFATPVLAAPAISQDANTISITAASGATIHYTIDGSDPTASSAQYTQAFDIAADTVVKAIAVQSGYTTSAAASRSCVYVNTAGDTTLDLEAVDFKFASDAAAAADDNSTFGTAGSRFGWAKEDAAGSDGVLVIEGVDAKPGAWQKTVFGLQLASAAASPSKISFRIKVGADYAADWYQYVKVVARLGEAWAWTEASALIKYPQDGFTADAWKVIELDAADFTGGSLADLRAVTFEFGRDYPGGAAAFSDILIDWVDVQ